MREFVFRTTLELSYSFNSNIMVGMMRKRIHSNGTVSTVCVCFCSHSFREAGIDSVIQNF